MEKGRKNKTGNSLWTQVDSGPGIFEDGCKYHQDQLLTSISLEQQMFHILLTLLKWK